MNRRDLQLGGSVATLSGKTQQEAFLAELEAIHWNVFVQAPPAGRADPEQVIKYLARYMTGGPLSDHRMIDVTDDGVTFLARPKRSKRKSKRGMNSAEPFTLSGESFIRRWALHVLPKGFIRSRSYGRYHHRHRKTYMEQCRELLQIESKTKRDHLETLPPAIQDQATSPTCPQCGHSLRLLTYSPRPSWSDIFDCGSSPVSRHRPTERPPPEEAAPA